MLLNEVTICDQHKFKFAFSPKASTVQQCVLHLTVRLDV